MNIVQTVIDEGFARSGAEARRLVYQGGVKLNGKVITDTLFDDIFEGDLLEVGKRKKTTIKNPDKENAF